MILKSCVSPQGNFQWGIHKPTYKVKNFRSTTPIDILGHTDKGAPIKNEQNFPKGDIQVDEAQPIVEIPNPFPFWGATYILTSPADRFAEKQKDFKFSNKHDESEDILELLATGKLNNPNGEPVKLTDLPRPILLAAAQTSKNITVLTSLAKLACALEFDQQGRAIGITFKKGQNNKLEPIIYDYELFEILGNNPALPYDYKLAMVLKPGIQGSSPIVGEFCSENQTHIWEYLRANSYIPWGHYASNMAHDCVRYKASELTWNDMKGLRHLYYQRIFTQMAHVLKLDLPSSLNDSICALTPDELDSIRKEVLKKIKELTDKGKELPYSATLWGWNYGFDFAPTGYRLHASHQQIHNQFALIKPFIKSNTSSPMPSYAVGDMVADFCNRYKNVYSVPFFSAYLKAIKNNQRIDGRNDRPSSLIIWEDENVLLFVPKAQRSQGEIQIITKNSIGNILESDKSTRASLDKAILLAIQTLDSMGAEMVTCGEISKRFDNHDEDQRLIYFFLPRHVDSPGAFSERQERWITGHYPEDYAESARRKLK